MTDPALTVGMPRGRDRRRGRGRDRGPSDPIAGPAGPSVHGEGPRSTSGVGSTSPRRRATATRRRSWRASSDRRVGRWCPASVGCSSGATTTRSRAPPPAGRLRRRHARRVPHPRARCRSSDSAAVGAVLGSFVVGSRHSPQSGSRCAVRVRRLASREAGSSAAIDRSARADPPRALHREPDARDARAHRGRTGPGHAANRRPWRWCRGRGACERCSTRCATVWPNPKPSVVPPSSRPNRAAARTYKLFAAGAERGVDLADGLRALSEDLRDARREDIRQTATKRRAAMLVPTIAVLAPVMLLFIAAPLPSIVFGSR